MQVSSTKQITKLELLKESSLNFLAPARHTKTQNTNNMPRSTTLTPHNILEIQEDLDASLETERQRHQKETLKNSTAIGREIETLRTSAGLSRRQVCKLLGVSYSSLYFIERPAAATVPSVIKPSNQMRYLKAVSQLAEGTKKLAEGTKKLAADVNFVARRGRPRKVLAKA